MTQAFITVPLSRMSDDTLKPFEYLDFARRDIIKGDVRALVNALSNIKRAIDCQLDVILEMYGLLKLSINKKWPFPKKIETIQKIGVVSPNILNLINSRRIQLEHRHRKPEKDEVAEFLDIAELFIELFRFRKRRIELLIDYDNNFAFLMDTERNTICIYEDTKVFWDMGGIKMFKETVQSKNIKPVKTIPISDLDEWCDACGRYIRAMIG
jgi:hypothetical protein